MAKLIQVIEVVTTYGRGTDEAPFRSVVEYYSTDGQLLAVSDPNSERVEGSKE